MKRITSRANPAYRRLLKLSRDPAERRARNRIVLDGIHLLEAYLARYGTENVELVRSESFSKRPVHEDWVSRVSVPVLVLADALFRELAPVETPTGILGIAPHPMHPPKAGPEGLSVFLDGIQDPGNLGSIVRSAAAAGARCVLLSLECADPWSPRALRAGMGAHFLIDIEEHADLVAAAKHRSGPVIAAVAAEGRSLFDTRLGADPAFVFGNEGKGIRPELLAETAGRISIPTAPGVESLNVAAAAAVCFFEWRRQQGPGSLLPSDQGKLGTLRNLT